VTAEDGRPAVDGLRCSLVMRAVGQTSVEGGHLAVEGGHLTIDVVVASQAAGCQGWVASDRQPRALARCHE
jgi:hypothetical protein